MRTGILQQDFHLWRAGPDPVPITQVKEEVILQREHVSWLRDRAFCEGLDHALLIVYV